MAPSYLNLWTVFCAWFVLICLHRATGTSGWEGCLDGKDVYATMKENSLSGEVVAKVMADTPAEGVQWSVVGKDADWFFLDETNIRLNASGDKILDREALGPVLMAELSCREEDVLQSVYRIMVEILNENDNSPVFTENTSRSLIISELTPVNTVVFTVQAADADNDTIIYSIDQTSPDAEYFKVNLPNSGEVILSKPLDYETKTQLNVTIHASEMNTAEHYNTSTNIILTILDGDDQYPQFLPCGLFLQDEISRICTSPIYTVNVTEGQEDMLLDFSPGPIKAVDGDRGLRASVSYAILSGDVDGRFRMDKETGEIRLIKGVKDRLTTPVIQLQVMAYQDNDPRKYSVATVLVRILAVNLFYPKFDLAEYHGFVTAGKSRVSLVITYGNKALLLHVHDDDFNQGFNPRIYFAFTPTSNHTDIYQVTQEGLLIAKSRQIKPNQKHHLEVMAVDQESGDTTFTTVVVEVLTEGQSIPHNQHVDGRLTGCTVGKALFLSMVTMTVIGCISSILMWLKRKHNGMRDPLERGCVAQGKHPNVSLRWFQLVNHRSCMANIEEVSYKSEEFGTCNPSFSFSDNPVIHTKQNVHFCQDHAPQKPSSSFNINLISTSTACGTGILKNNIHESTNTSTGSSTVHPSRESLNSTNTDRDIVKNQTPDAIPKVTSDLIEEQSLTMVGAATNNKIRSSSLTDSNSQPTADDNIIHQVTNPPSPTTSPSSQIQTSFKSPSSEMAPIQSLPFPKETVTPPLTPELGLLKATLVHLDTSPTNTPPDTPKEANYPCTSLDQADTSEPTGGVGNAQGSSQDRRLSTNSEKNPDGPVVGKDDDGFLGDEDADKNNESEDELESDEEELLRVMARCNPIFITFNK